MASSLGTFPMPAKKAFSFRQRGLRRTAATMLLAVASCGGPALADQRPHRTDPGDSTRVQEPDSPGGSLVRAVLQACGASAARSRQSGNEYRAFADELRAS